MIREQIRTFFRGSFLEQQPLSNYTWMKVGGPADYFLEPVDEDDLIGAVNFLTFNRIPYMMIGRGANIIVSDRGYRGAVINIESGMSKCEVRGRSIRAEAGVWIVKFVDICVQNGLGGVEMLAGIPGTMGGAIIMNAGAFGGEISDHLVSVECYRNGTRMIIPKAECGFGYRTSGLVKDIVLAANFTLPEAMKEEIAARRREILIQRNQLQPVNLPNSGSMFKNPQGDHAAKLIDETGLKGYTVGGIKVSEKHANFFVNFGGATAADVFALMKHVRTEVFRKTGILLEPEVKLVGFTDEERSQLTG